MKIGTKDNKTYVVTDRSAMEVIGNHQEIISCVKSGLEFSFPYGSEVLGPEIHDRSFIDSLVIEN